MEAHWYPGCGTELGLLGFRFQIGSDRPRATSANPEERPMNVTTQTGQAEKYSEAEWKVRCDLAALYRLVAYHRWTDLIFTHISARIPGPEHHFLINRYGVL